MFWELNMLSGSLFGWLACCIHLYVFFLSKNLFSSSSTATRQIPIYRAPWTSFLDRSYRIFDPSSFLDFVSIASWSIKKISVWPIDSRQNLDPSRNFCRRQILDSTSTDSCLSRFIARQILIAPQSIEMRFLYISSVRNQTSFSLLSLDRKSFLSLQTLSSHSNLYSFQVFGLIKLQSCGMNF